MNFKALSGGIPISGAHFLIELEDKRIVIDCGAVQTGGKVLPPPIAKGRIDALFLTHGHLDHIGMLPIFVNEHPDTPVYGTKVTWRFARMLLWDSFRVAMHKLERGEKVETYFSASDIERALNLKKFNLVREPEWFSPWPGWKIRFWPAGHINGAASLGQRAHGDVGRPARREGGSRSACTGRNRLTRRSADPHPARSSRGFRRRQ